MLSYQVHLVDQTEYLCLRGKFCQCIETVFVIGEVSTKIFASNIEYVDEDLHVLENMLSLGLEVLFHKQILATAIPQV